MPQIFIIRQFLKTILQVLFDALPIEIPQEVERLWWPGRGWMR